MTRDRLKLLWRWLPLVVAVPLVLWAARLWRSEDGRAAPGHPPSATAAPALPAEETPPPVAEFVAAGPPQPKTREELRFARADRDDDGRISQAEYLVHRRRNFDRLDTNGDGRLTFEEYAAEGYRKFAEADRDRNGVLNPQEYATTARPPTTSTAARRTADCG
ncbi:MAG: EF-hand domain-containing protein [Sphingomonadaceae bacterium]|uniref:EF-hand domain-containing protein n=1 Tax=Thermaurantiacus sp. TaxID=2820283 RepID=UPI00298F17DF|nr:EF-hand domain-containing protein [Thermaurantiacus sp.]MCS6986934.1 EF-hand domain-containing protein [Sphingomonadaceae bacterium]MDW8415466.1 EF-hand domain-containing protein [Thermaurantiacus sp.]